MWRMSYAERLLGWPGVMASMTRERITRTNCDAGRYTDVRDVDGDAGYVQIAGGRVVMFGKGGLQLFDVDSGAFVVSFDVEGEITRAEAVRDRWLVFEPPEYGVFDPPEYFVWMLDCIAAKLVKLALPDEAGDQVQLSACDACVAVYHAVGVTVFRIEAGPDDTSVVREAHVNVPENFNEFALCEGGQSYLLLDWNTPKLHVCDLATGAVNRVLTLRACPIVCC